MKNPNPTAAQVTAWLDRHSHQELQDIGWITVCRRFPGITSAIAPYLRQQFTNDKEHLAAYEGLTLALLAVAHFEDIQKLNELFDSSSGDEPAADR